MVVVDDIAGKLYKQIGSGGVVFSPDSSRFGYTAAAGDNWTVVVDGREGLWYKGVMENGPVFSPNSKKIAFAAQTGEKWFVVMNGTAGPFYDAIGNDTLTFSPDSRRLAYVGKKKSKWLVIADGIVGRLYDDIGRESLTFSPGGRHLVYSARRGERWFVVLDGTEGRAYHNIFTGFGGEISFNVTGFRYKALQGFSVIGVNEHWFDKENGAEQQPGKASLKEYTFRFNPPSGTRFIATQHMTGKMELDKLTEANLIFEQNLKAEYLFAKTKDGFNIKVRLISFEGKSNGQNVNLELGSILKDTNFTIVTDPQGHLLRIDGIDSYYQKLQACISKNVLKEHEALFSKEGLEKRFRDEWEGSFGGFVGKSFRLGDFWTVEDKVMLPNQDYLNFTATVRFSDQVRQNNRDFIKIKFEGTLDNKAIEKYMNELGNTKRDISLNTKLETKVTGEELIDPETMLKQSNNMTLIMKMALDTPQGRANVSTIIQSETTIKYLN
jgi:hypothetical protein